MFKKLITSILIGTLFFNCTEEPINNGEVQSLDNEITKQFKLIGKSLSMPKYDFEVNKKNNFITKKMSNFLKTNKNYQNNIQYFEINTKSERGILKINTLFINDGDSSKNNNVETTMVDIQDEDGNNTLLQVRFEKLIDQDALKILDIRPIDSYANKSLSSISMYSKDNCYGSYSVACIDDNGDGQVSYGECFGACIGYALDTDELPGQLITGLGIAGGVGCGPCGIAAGALAGFAALGCAGGCA